jgi:ketosteroid isomerase-like protein
VTDQAAERAVLAANTALYDAFESADLELMQSVWLDGPHAEDVICVHPGWAPLRGRGAVLRSWAMIMANTAYVQFVLTDVDVTVDGDVAVVTCAENILTGMPEVSEPLQASDTGLSGGRVAATNVFRRTDSGWRLWVHHSSPVIPTGDADVDIDLDDRGRDEDRP